MNRARSTNDKRMTIKCEIIKFFLQFANASHKTQIINILICEIKVSLVRPTEETRFAQTNEPTSWNLLLFWQFFRCICIHNGRLIVHICISFARKLNAEKVENQQKFGRVDATHRPKRTNEIIVQYCTMSFRFTWSRRPRNTKLTSTNSNSWCSLSRAKWRHKFIDARIFSRLSCAHSNCCYHWQLSIFSSWSVECLSRPSELCNRKSQSKSKSKTNAETTYEYNVRHT